MPPPAGTECPEKTHTPVKYRVVPVGMPSVTFGVGVPAEGSRFGVPGEGGRYYLVTRVAAHVDHAFIGLYNRFGDY